MVSGYILKLNKERTAKFESLIKKEFSEPVAEFTHSRHIPLICFILNHKGFILSIGLGKRGFKAGTDLRKLNITEIYNLEKPVYGEDVVNKTNTRVIHSLRDKIQDGGLLGQKGFEEFLQEFIKLSPETKEILEKYTIERYLKIKKLSESKKNALAEQQEAISTALNIAGIDRECLQGWDFEEKTEPSSYLDGIKNEYKLEDSVLINDLFNFPGFDLKEKKNFSATIFENEKTTLSVLLTHREPLEKLMGTDLIYFNENLKCFVMIQYKMMNDEQKNEQFYEDGKETEKNNFRFRLPDAQFSEEIERMDRMNETLNELPDDGTVKDFRFNNSPFFIKLCPRKEFNPDNVGLTKGMYLPLEYFKLLMEDESIKGIRGGRFISYENVGRYFDNTAFKTIIENGWIGTNKNQSEILKTIISESLKSKKGLVIAKKRTKGGNTLEKKISTEKLELLRKKAEKIIEEQKKLENSFNNSNTED